MISKLYLELALCRRTSLNKESYKLITATQAVDGDTLNKIRESPTNVNSFIDKLKNVSEERKLLLRLVEHRILVMLAKNPNLFHPKGGYLTSLSYLYFAFTDEDEKTVFSAPYMTSSLLFNPNDSQAAYTLCPPEREGYGGFTDKTREYCKIHKRVSASVAKKERPSYYGYDDYTEGHLGSSGCAVKDDIDPQTVSNSLFNYYEAKYAIAFSHTGNSFVSCYADMKTISLDISTISSYELQQFLYLSETKTTKHSF